MFTRLNEEGEYVPEVVELKPGVDGVTELDIKRLHQRDDLDMYYFYKASRPERSPEEKAKIENWKVEYAAEFVDEHGYEPDEDYVDWIASQEFPRNYNVSLNQFDDYCDEGKNPLMMAINKASINEKPEEPRLDRLREVVKMLTPYQQSVYRMMIHEQKSQVEIAEEVGVTKQAINKSWNNIKMKIKNLFWNFFREEVYFSRFSLPVTCKGVKTTYETKSRRKTEYET